MVNKSHIRENFSAKPITDVKLVTSGLRVGTRTLADVSATLE
jgi:hypothetical protein